MSIAAFKKGLWVGLVISPLLGCTRLGGPDAFKGSEFPDSGVGTTTVTTPLCATVMSSQPMPARSTVVNPAGQGSSNTTYFTNDLFGLFYSMCGSCHVDQPLGNFQITKSSFTQLPAATVIPRMETDDTNNYVMPPYGVPFSARGPNDPVVQLDQLLKIWIAQGKPSGTFTLSPAGGGGASGDYAVTPTLSTELTNIGSCVPNREDFGTNQMTMGDLDTQFAQMNDFTDLPDSIGDTDMTTLDSETLAQNGVVSFAPAYPLWSDNAYKMRHVRVPMGQSIAFDKTTQQFQIPPNTRFYKTFFKKVIDSSGTEAYRKIETRLIVARPDQNNADGTVTQTAIYGTYVWNDDETDAKLLKDPLRNSKPFRDHVLTYITDEPKAQAIIDANPPDLDYELEVANPGLVRHYAIPGSERCKQCHMGSASQSFILGFTPLQIARQPEGASGVLEPAMGDELTQLQRFIDLGVVTGIASPDDVLPLEQSQGDRQPRNSYELTAQAYMVGNCAHCHNPRGFPSIKEPLLKDDLDFLPGPGPNQGIFQFNMQATSRVRQRGPNQDVPVPYITPSLRDNPVEFSQDAKWIDCTQDPLHLCRYPAQKVEFISAPWRSLIYRNVDTPFDYVEDNTIFPHMPMNTPGYDCRVAKIMGDWMVSIPAVLVHPNLNEDAVLGGVKTQVDYTPPANANTDAQPYVEVKPDDPKWGQGLIGAQQRLTEYHAGRRYNYCVDTTDTIDPLIQSAADNGLAVPRDTAPVFDPNDPTVALLPDTGVPLKPHWVVTDTTEPPGDWQPRRSDWATAIVNHVGQSNGGQPEDVEFYNDVVQALADANDPDQKLKLDYGNTRAILTAEIPFGTWQQKPGCDFTNVSKVSDYAQNRQPWMDVANPASSAPVYMQSPGGAVFNTICFNCHGPQADSHGLLADEIALMTGGDARVANFRDGLFGPVATPGTNRMTVFGPAAAAFPSGPLTADDLGARYLAWMALGGTTKHLPSDLLSLVAGTRIFGSLRNPKFIDPQATPDMLQLGLQLCTHVLTGTRNVQTIAVRNFFSKGVFDWSNQTSLIDSNGDAELWLRLCSLNNRPIVHVVDLVNGPRPLSPSTVQLNVLSLYWGDVYPATADVMDHHGHVTKGISPDNPFPICARVSSDPNDVTNQFVAANPVGGASGHPIPSCPAELFAAGNQLDNGPNGNFTYKDARSWASRGAINAGIAVFLYLDRLERGLVTPKPPYNHCEQAPAGTLR
jgi:mono/diheme cytochrome c family protein